MGLYAERNKIENVRNPQKIEDLIVNTGEDVWLLTSFIAVTDCW